MKTEKFYTEDKRDTKWLTIIACLACMGVVTIHCNNFMAVGPVTDPRWISTVIMQALIVCSVPLFFIISGATLLDYPDRYSTKTYFWKRVKKTVIPYIVWIFICFFYYWGIGRIQSNQINFAFFWNAIFLGGEGINPNYWFFPYLFLLYLMIPILAFVKKPIKERICVGIIIFGLVGTFTIPWILSVCKSDMRWLWGLGVFYPIVFACFGYLIRNYKFSLPFEITIISIGALAFIGIIVGTYFMSLQEGKCYGAFVDLMSIFPCLYAMGMAVLLKRIGHLISPHKVPMKVFTFVAQFTFVIYLSHNILLDVLYNYFYLKLCGLDFTSFTYRFTAPLLIFLIVIGITWVLRKIPGMKYILPK